jgi:hypothetical protein
MMLGLRMVVGEAFDLLTASVICVAIYTVLVAACAAAAWHRQRRDRRHARSVPN